MSGATGPWFVGARESGAIVTGSPQGMVLFRVPAEHAPIVAAAPELLDALRQAVEALSCGDPNARLNALRDCPAAIAKATEAVCPKCNGTAREVLEESQRRYRIATYRESDHTIACRNCGGQTMSSTATGRTRVDPATGLGCMHTYSGQSAGRCYVIHTCTKCGDQYGIDSSD